MTDPTVIDVDPFSAIDLVADHFPFPPLALSHDDDGDDAVPLEDLDFDFSFDDLEIPMSESLNNLIDHGQDLFEPQVDLRGVFKSASPELRRGNKKCHLSQQSWTGLGALSSHADSVQVLGYLNGEVSDGGVKGLNCPSPDTQGSENYGSKVSEESNNCAVSSKNVNCSIVDQKVKLESDVASNSNYSNNCNSLVKKGDDKCLLKRKEDDDDSMTNISSSKCRKSNNSGEGKSCCNNDNNDGVLSEEEEKRRARLMRNRESAQLSRQRKKHYVEELEEKVRSMNSTIHDLNSKISYFMAENSTLRQQMCNGGSGSVGASGSGAVPHPMVPPPPPGMYPHPAVMYPWMAGPTSYTMKPPGSQVPLLPIPRLKPQQPRSKSSKKVTSKKVERKGNEGAKTKKVAGVSFLGLLFFFLLVIGLVPMVNQRYGGFRDVLTGEDVSYNGGGYKQHHGRVLMVNGTEYDEATGGRKEFSSDGNVCCGKNGHSSGGGEPSGDDFVRLGNGSEPLAASLYVPRNDKLVKIDGNLIIHSVLASERAVASHEKSGEETGLVPVPEVGPSDAGPPHLRALGSGTTDEESTRSTTNDWKLQQWFREGLAGPMLSSGMCTKVFQFDVSTATTGAIVQAATPANISNTEHTKNSTHLSKARNRRFLRGVPIPIPTHNISSTGSSGDEEELSGNNNSSSSSMVVSVLFDPREVGDSDVDGVMETKKSLSRIFVVVLIDSVKYVTYSCMLPFKASAPLVTT